MTNLTKLWTGVDQPADSLRYGTGHPGGHSASCQWFSFCGGGFRTRAAYGEHGGLWGSDPGCYLNEAERTGVELLS